MKYYITAAFFFVMMLSIYIIVTFDKVVVVQNHATEEPSSQQITADLDDEHEVDDAVSHQRSSETEIKKTKDVQSQAEAVVETITPDIVKTEPATEMSHEREESAIEAATETKVTAETVTETAVTQDAPVTKPLIEETDVIRQDLLQVAVEENDSAALVDVEVNEMVVVNEPAAINKNDAVNEGVVASVPSPKIETNIVEAVEAEIEWPKEKQRKFSKYRSYKALLGLWNLKYDSVEHGTPCTFAKSQGFSCHRDKGIDTLQEFNRPAVLTLYNDVNKVQYATLKEIKGNKAKLILSGKEQVVSLTQLQKHWKGDYLFFWSIPEGYFQPMVPGDSGRAVLWLSRRMLEVTKHPDLIPHNNYDDILLDQIKAFQMKEGLDDDGVVGIRTLIHINQAINKHIPLLESS